MENTILNNRKMFVEHLKFMYSLAFASESLIETAAKETKNPALKKYYSAHLKEERGHVAWFLRDLKSANIKPDAVNWYAAQIAGMQYYLIKHVSPDALLGYMAALECRPTPIALVKELENIYGKKLLRTVRYHAENDPKHGADLLRLVGATPNLSQPLILTNFNRTAQMIEEVFTEIRRAA